MARHERNASANTADEPPRQNHAKTPYPRRWLALAVLDICLLAVTVDNTILNVAIPTLVRELGATSSQLQWIVDAYIVCFAGLLLTAGTLGDRLGRRRVLAFGLTILGIGSAGSAFVTNADQLILLRALMGAGAAFVMPVTLSIISNMFDDRERPRAIATWSAIAGLGMVVGPITGGWLLETFQWNAIFLANLPVVLGGGLAAMHLVPESRDDHPNRPDPVGALLSMAGLATLAYGIIEAPTAGWTSGNTLVGIGLGVGLLALLVAWELRTTAPMLDVRLFLRPRFGGASFGITVAHFAIAGAMFGLTQYLQFVRGLRPLDAGISLLPVAVGVVLGSATATRLLPRVGTKLLMAPAMALSSLGLLLLAQVSVDTPYAQLAGALVVLAFGMGLGIMPGTESIMGAVSREQAGVGSATNDTTREIGAALGVAVLGSVLSGSFRDAIGPLASLPPQLAAAARESIGSAVGVAALLPGPAGARLLEQAREAFVSGLSVALVAGAIVTAVAVPVVLAVLPARAARSLRDERQATGEDGVASELTGAAVPSVVLPDPAAR